MKILCIAFLFIDALLFVDKYMDQHTLQSLIT
jgi:hypothetical protein